MNTRLKLVSQHGVKVRHPRPIVTDYQEGNLHAREARSCTTQNAITAAISRVLKYDYRGASIYNEHGQLVVTIKRVRHGIMIHGQKRGYL